MNIPSPLVSVSLGLAAAAWLVFAASQSGRKHAVVLAWLCLPFFVLMGSYVWFSVESMDIEIRAVHARIGIMAISLSQGIILLVISYLNRGWKNAKHL